MTDDQYSPDVMAAKEQIDYCKLWTAPCPAASFPQALYHALIYLNLPVIRPFDIVELNWRVCGYRNKQTTIDRPNI